jgi:hypothetical protein
MQAWSLSPHGPGVHTLGQNGTAQDFLRMKACSRRGAARTPLLLVVPVL